MRSQGNALHERLTFGGLSGMRLFGDIFENPHSPETSINFVLLEVSSECFFLVTFYKLHIPLRPRFHFSELNSNDIT